MDYIGKNVLIVGDHPHSGEVGVVTDYKEASALRKRGYIVEIDCNTSFFVFEERNLQLVSEKKGRR